MSCELEGLQAACRPQISYQELHVQQLSRFSLCMRCTPNGLGDKHRVETTMENPW